MNCRDCQTWIENLLDGQASPETDALREHLRQCRSCRRDVAAARLLLQGMTKTPKARIELAPRLVAAVARDRADRKRRSTYRWYAIAGLAASLLFMFGFGNLASLWAKKFEPPQVATTTPQPPVAEPQLTERADDAQKAVAKLTRSVAEKTKTHLEVLWSAANPRDAASVFPPLPDFDEPLDPAAESLRHAGRTVAKSLEPMTNPARQAFSFIAREMPVFDLSR